MRTGARFTYASRAERAAAVSGSTGWRSEPRARGKSAGVRRVRNERDDDDDSASESTDDADSTDDE